jgi:hypothetical protein
MAVRHGGGTQLQTRERYPVGAGFCNLPALVLVAGIFRTDIPEVDRGVVQLPLETARQWLAIGEDATSLNVILHSDRRTGEIARDVQERLGAAGVGDGDSAEAICARSIRALRSAGVRHFYVSNLPLGRAAATTVDRPDPPAR